eukprot:2013202-Prymnesium_polylepis.1
MSACNKQQPREPHVPGDANPYLYVLAGRKPVTEVCRARALQLWAVEHAGRRRVHLAQADVVLDARAVVEGLDGLLAARRVQLDRTAASVRAEGLHLREAQPLRARSRAAGLRLRLERRDRAFHVDVDRLALRQPCAQPDRLAAGALDAANHARAARPRLVPVDVLVLLTREVGAGEFSKRPTQHAHLGRRVPSSRSLDGLGRGGHGEQADERVGQRAGAHHGAKESLIKSAKMLFFGGQVQWFQGVIVFMEFQSRHCK